MKKLAVVSLFVFSLMYGVTWGICPTADLTGDCQVTLEDYAVMAAQWLYEGADVVYPSISQPTGETTITLTVEDVRGSSEVSGREDTISVISYSHSITVPYSSSTGKPSEGAVNGTIDIVKYVDRATPQLLQKMSTNEVISSCQLDFYWTNLKGSKEVYYTVKLKNVFVIGYEAVNNVEKISFASTQMTFTYVNDDQEASIIF